MIVLLHSPVIGDNVKAEPILKNRFHLTRQQIDLTGCFRLVGVADLQETVAHLAPPPLPNVAQPALGPLEQVAVPPIARLCVTLRLVQRVLTG